MSSHFRQFIKSLLPQFMKEAYINSRKKRKQKIREELIANQQGITKQDISQKLSEIGLRSRDVVMLHSSLSKIGYVEGGAQTIIDSFLEVIGTTGTLVMPSFPAIGYNYDYLNSKPIFNVKETPSKMGIITEAFRTMKGVQRSLHPTDPVCAFGTQADYLVKDHFNQLTPYNEQSPFYKLVGLNAKIVLIGVDLNSLTNFHTLEDAVKDFKYPVYHQTIFDAKAIDENGKEHRMKTKVHDSAMSKKRQCNEFMMPFENAGILKQFKLGLANCMVIDANKMHHWMVEQYLKHGVTLYSSKGKVN